MAEFRMPQLGADMAAGTLTEWLRKPGDKVARGDIIAVVETDKGAIEIEAFEDGVIDSLIVEPGTKVPVGTPLAMIRGEGEAPSAAPPRPEPAPPKPEPAAAKPVPRPAQAPLPPVSAPPPSAAAPLTGPRISPAAARRAAELGVALAGLAGTGQGGAIHIADVERAAAGGVTAAPAVPAEPATPAEAMRRAIAAAMSRANRDIPHYFLAQPVDVTGALDWLAAANQARPVTGRLLFGALLLKAVALALRDYPDFNGFWRDGAFQPGAGIHVGSATSIRGGGLVAPAIHDTDRMSLDELMAALRDLVKRARALRLTSGQMADATITVSSLGDQGVEALYGVIYPPQVALVGFGSVEQRPWVVDGEIVSRRILLATLSADHRASDGRRGALFLRRIGERLQDPEGL